MKTRDLLVVVCFVTLLAAASRAASPLSAPVSFDVVQHKAFNFFWNQTNPNTGLTNDRAHNIGPIDAKNDVASIASTGYALAALPIGVTHGWITKRQGYVRALTTLRFFDTQEPNVHGFYYHFVNAKTGARVWNCEVSSIDTALLIMGARVAGDYWPGTAVQTLADRLTERVDWRWMETDGGTKSLETAPSMGWYPDKGFIAVRWQGYNEGIYLYWLALGSKTHAIPAAAWDKWDVATAKVEGVTVPGGPNPLFMAEMASGFVNLKGMRDRAGRDWWSLWQNAVLADRAYCLRNPDHFATYAQNFWGVNANDMAPPTGYGAGRPVSGGNDGTSSPTAMLASIIYTPKLAAQALANLSSKHSAQLYGVYGFSNAFNVDKHWYDKDVIGIDLGMMLLAIEDRRSGMIWNLMHSDATIQRGLLKAGFHATGN